MSGIEKCHLVVSFQDAKTKLTKQIDEGQKFLDSYGSYAGCYEPFREQVNIWNDVNSTILKQIFSTPDIHNELQAFRLGRIKFVRTGEPTEREKIQTMEQEIKRSLEKLKSIDTRLEHYVRSHPEPFVVTEGSKDVFVVHGHDDEVREATARLISAIGLVPTVLGEQPNRSMTIIEKLEANASVHAAVVILTADDVGGKKGEQLRPRARQNVVLELGFFMGRLGRNRVCALLDESIEQPSDYHGITYINLDPNNAWRTKLTRELEAMGFQVDYSKIPLV